MAKDAILNPLVVGDWVAVGNGRMTQVHPRVDKIVGIDGDLIKFKQGQWVNSGRAVNITQLLCSEPGNPDAPYKDMLGVEITEDDYLAVAFGGLYKPRWFGAKLRGVMYQMVWIGDAYAEGVFNDSGDFLKGIRNTNVSALRITDIMHPRVKRVIDIGIGNYDRKKRSLG